jgi:hypothetical protein
MDFPVKLTNEAPAWKPRTALPQAVRAYGSVPDFTKWHPGDVIITRAKKPDFISQQIQSIQTLGYAEASAAWTHAAVYLGDGIMLCEAQIDPIERLFEVIVAPIWGYIGTHEILVKRSKWALDKEGGWAIATAAASKIGASYDWQFLLKLLTDRIFVGDRVWQQDQTGKISAKAFVCSSLYSTAHAYATDVTITDKMNGLCVPAYLASEEFHLRNVEFSWRKIA